jgi:hypothetical protein
VEFHKNPIDQHDNKMPDSVSTRSKTDPKGAAKSNPMTQTPTGPSEDRIFRRMDEYFEKLSQKLDDSIDKINDRMDYKMGQLRMDIKDDIRNDLLPRIEQNAGQIAATNHKVKQLEETIVQLENTLELKAKENELIVRGVPVTGNSCHRVYQSLATAVGFDPQRIPVADAFRLKGKRVMGDSCPPILLRFAHKFDKAAFHNLYFKKKTLNLTDIGFEIAARVYITENLTKVNQQIFGAALKLKKEGVFTSVSTHYGSISVKKSEEGGRITVRRLADLDGLKKN